MLFFLLPLAALLLRVEGRHGETVVTNNNNGHALDNDKWLSTVSQYDKDRYWNKFRDDDYFKSWGPAKPLGQEPEARPGRRGEPGSKAHSATVKRRTHDGLDATKDPCLKVRCPPHKVCISQDYQTAICTNPKQPAHSVKPRKGSLAHKHGAAAGAHGKCRPCPVVRPSPVCGSDGHTYTSQCKLEFQGCLSGKSVSVKCEGPCPCLPGQELLQPQHADKTDQTDVSVDDTIDPPVDPGDPSDSTVANQQASSDPSSH
ncbi:testican-1-like [Aplochiton taeniatus]